MLFQGHHALGGASATSELDGTGIVHDPGWPIGRVLAGQEAMEVTEAVAAIAARVDPVIAKSPGVTPRANRVRVNAQDLCGACDAERRVVRTRMMQIHLRQAPTTPQDS